MAEHTKGPWDFALAEPDIHRIGIYANDGETIICDVTGEDLQVADQLGANARLIAAAPELLAACQEALEHLRFEVEEAGPLKDRLIAAIARAKEGVS